MDATALIEFRSVSGVGKVKSEENKAIKHLGDNLSQQPHLLQGAENEITGTTMYIGLERL